MEMALTGRMMDAEEAERAGLVSRIVPTDELVDEAVAIAEKIANLSQPVVMLAKESVNAAPTKRHWPKVSISSAASSIRPFRRRIKKKVCLRSPKNALPNSSIAERRPQTKIPRRVAERVSDRKAWISAGLGLDATVMRHYKPRLSMNVYNGI